MVKSGHGRRRVNPTIQGLLYLASGGACAICKKSLVKLDGAGDPFGAAHTAHIEAASSGGPRYNPAQSDEERYGYDNLIVLCRDCHGTVDIDLVTFTVGYLKSIKRDHEAWRERNVQLASTQLSFAELEVIVQYLVGSPPSDGWPVIDYIPIMDKITRNRLDNHVMGYLRLGLGQSRLVQDYLNRQPDPHFPGRLRDGFVQKYDGLKSEGLVPTDIFLAMVRFSTSGSLEPLRMAAGLAVLSYFFELCEVFEK